MRWLSVALIPFAVQAVACGGEAPQPAELTGATGTAATTSSTTGGGDGGAGGAGDGGAGGSTDVGGGDAVSYPDPDWPTATPAEVGLDAAQLDVAAQIAEDADSHCLVVIRQRDLAGSKPLVCQRRIADEGEHGRRQRLKADLGVRHTGRGLEAGVRRLTIAAPPGDQALDQLLRRDEPGHVELDSQRPCGGELELGFGEAIAVAE